VTDETRNTAGLAPPEPPTEPVVPPLARPKGWLLGYPTDHLMGVLPSPAAAEAATAELERSGIAPGDIRVLVGEEAALRIDGRGTQHGVLARLYRLLQFTQMDQAPDFRRYEREARRGHPVVAVKETDPARRKVIRTIMRGQGAHFTNFYGRFATETLDPYEGPDEGDLPI
jgi:hypothetical protein